MSTVPTLNSGGGILLLDRALATKIGGFDGDYMLGWGDDGEFYQRLLRFGLKCLYVPTAVAYHEDKLRNRERNYRVEAQIFNRWQFIFTHYSAITLVLLTPAFLFYEIIQCAFLSYKRMLFLYFKGSFYSFKSLPEFLAKRKKIQAIRRVSDKEVLFSGPIYVSPSLIENSKILKLLLKTINSFFDIYWKSVKPFIP